MPNRSEKNVEINATLIHLRALLRLERSILRSEMTNAHIVNSLLPCRCQAESEATANHISSSLSLSLAAQIKKLNAFGCLRVAHGNGDEFSTANGRIKSE